MFFSNYFGVSDKIIKDYGAVNISLDCDIPLFIDPMLIFNSDKLEYKDLHDQIIKYFYFLLEKSKAKLSYKQYAPWFNFNEICNNWLGYSLVGNKGLALGKKYAEFLYGNIDFAVNKKGIAKGDHFERVMLLYDGSGQDKISDLMVNILLGFFCEYTQNFAKVHIDKNKCDIFRVDKSSFNYETESFVCNEYYLPYIINEKGKKEFVLLTPYDILRKSEPTINKKDFFDNYEMVCSSIDNDSLRAYVNNYIQKAVLNYAKSQKEKKKTPTDAGIKRAEKEAFTELVRSTPALYDYYIKLKEDNFYQIRQDCLSEYKEQDEFLENTKELILLLSSSLPVIIEKTTAQEEAKKRLKYFKHMFEDCDCYKNLYLNDQPIAQESDLQRMFRMVWCETNYKVDAEANNGRGQTDFIVSKGSKNQSIVEFKLGSNSSLSHVFTQVEIYEKANCATGSLIAIFCFTEEEIKNTESMIKAHKKEHLLNESIFIIDCRKDNKKSASVA